MIKSERIIRILVIEEEDDYFDQITDALYQNKYDVFEVIRAKTLKKAIIKIESNGIDIILTDLNLPDATGLQTVFELNEKADIPFIVISQLEDYSLIIKSIKSGASDYFIKGKYSINELSRAIRYAIDNYNLNKELTKYKEFDKFQTQTDNFNLDPSPTKALRVRDIKSFAQARKHYIKCLDRKVKDDEVYKECIEDLACVLVRALATAQDVLRIHTLTLKDKISKNRPELAKRYVEESKIVLTELFAKMVSRYRNKIIRG